MNRSTAFPRSSIGWNIALATAGLALASCTSTRTSQAPAKADASVTGPRERISINGGWTFFKYDSAAKADDLVYDERPEVTNRDDTGPADAKPTEGVDVVAKRLVLKPWILPSGNDLIADPAKRHARPAGDPGSDFPFVQADFDDTAWQHGDLPHDWAIAGPFYEGESAPVGGGMGRLPSTAVAWYRKQIDIPAGDAGKRIFLDVDGAMSYAIVWLNGHLVGGWPYGYSSWRLDLTPYIAPGGTNQLAIRLDNPGNSSRWYTGGGIFRNVWLTKTQPVHVAHWGTFVTTPRVSKESATLDLSVKLVNESQSDATVSVATDIYELDANGNRSGAVVATFDPFQVTFPGGKSASVRSRIELASPRLWGPAPTQTPNRYVAVTTVTRDGAVIDIYETRFGIREVTFDPDTGIRVNGEHIPMRGVNQHHDLGALGAAFNTRAAERQLEILRDMGCNAIRIAHNPPAPELLELTDRMGMLVIDESFDVWQRRKTPLDHHLFYDDWHEQDMRALVRRDRNHPSVILWSIGNEVGEQYTGEAGADVARELVDIVREEDPTRPTTTAMNWAKSDMPLPAVVDVIGLNYQGEGIRQDPEFEGTERIRTVPQYPLFHAKFPNKVILTTESASAASSRGEYFFPVTEKISAPIRDGNGGGNPNTHQVSGYELYAVDFGSSADKVFASLDRHPYVAGEFVWNGFDYLGEPTPYYSSRSSYTGIIDLAGFPKDRYYLYQARWRPDLPMAHILPHWNWPDRAGKVTPVHVFTSGDEAELFLNGRSLGRKKKAAFEYRLRWDDVVYEPGELKVVAYKNGTAWATDIVRTTGAPAALVATVDRTSLAADGDDLAFVTVRVVDASGLTVPVADNPIRFSANGPAEIVATDNGDATDMIAFPSRERHAFNGLCLAIVRTIRGMPGAITIRAESDSLAPAVVVLRSNRHP